MEKVWKKPDYGKSFKENNCGRKIERIHDD